MADDLNEMLLRYFKNWPPLALVALGDLPRFGDAEAIYAMRSKEGEILKFGSTRSLRNRLFKNYVGGTGGSTTQWIHGLLFSEGHISEVEFAWLETDRSEAAEAQLRDAYRAAYGRLPRWMRR